MSSDENYSDFEMLSSQEKKSYSTVPEDTVFRIKVISEIPAKKIGYRLKMGTDLPCDKDLGGLCF